MNMKFKRSTPAENPILGVLNENQNCLFLPALGGVIFIGSGTPDLLDLTLQELLAQCDNLMERRPIYKGDTITITF